MRCLALLLSVVVVCAAADVSAQTGQRPTPQAPLAANVRVAPATAADIAALREENNALRARLDRITEALQRYANCETLRLALAQQPADAAAPPASLWCGSQEQNLSLLKNLD